MKRKNMKHTEDADKETLVQGKKKQNPDELEDANLENLAGGEGMTTGDIINP